jgi:predicted DNA-binding transcriptional regulator AlpA
MTGAYPLFITAAQVADLLGLGSGRAFLAQRARLERDHLFPPAVPLQLKLLRWRHAEVLAWVTRQGVAPTPMPAPRANVVQLRVM